MLAHVAEAMGIVAAETIAGAETMPVNYDMIPRATYCQPQIGSFGYSEAQAKEKGYDVKTATFPFSRQRQGPRAWATPSASSRSSPTPSTTRSSART